MQNSQSPDTTTDERPPGTILLGRIAGVQVLMRPSWILMALLATIVVNPWFADVAPSAGSLSYAMAFGFVILVYASVLLHEAAHAVMGRRLGYPVGTVTLDFLGGHTTLGAQSRSARDEFLTAVVGPLTSIAIGLAALGGWWLVEPGVWRVVLAGLAGTNLLLGALNLLPGFPLDGGRLLRAGVWGATGDELRGSVVSAWGGRVLAIACVLALPISALAGRPLGLFGIISLFIVGGFLWSASNAALMHAKLRRRLPSLSARTLARRVVVVDESMPLSQAVASAQQAQAGGIVTAASDGGVRGVVHEAALLAIPEERRAWVPASSVARTIVEGMQIPADLVGEPMIRAMAAFPSEEYVLVDGDGRVYGLLLSTDVDAAFRATSN